MLRMLPPIAVALLVAVPDVTWAGDRRVYELATIPILEIEDDVPRTQDVSFLDLPGVTLFRNTRGAGGSSLRLIDLPIVTLFASDRSGDRIDVRFVEIPFLGSLYRHQGNRESYRTELLFWLRVEGTTSP